MQQYLMDTMSFGNLGTGEFSLLFLCSDLVLSFQPTGLHFPSFLLISVSYTLELLLILDAFHIISLF